MLNKGEILQWIHQKGQYSTSFLTSYDGYQYFRSDEGVMAYVETQAAWVGAGGPLLNEFGDEIELLKKFKTAANRKSKDAMLLPVDAALAKRLRENGFSAICIGTEPWFSYENIPQRIHQTVQKLIQKGAVVESFDPLLLSTQERNALDLVTQEWILSRKMAPLSFLNRVEPWRFFTHKRYFRVIYNGIHVGYLAAVPVPVRKSWYLVDLIRSNQAPVGTTELLIVEATKQLMKQGARQVTLGMSPLVPVLDPDERRLHPKTYWLFNELFKRFNFIYGFGSLYAYKGKFNPSSWEPQYFVTLDSKVKLKMLYSLFQAMYPRGPLFILWVLLKKIPKAFSLRKIYQSTLNNQLVPRSPPHGYVDFIQKAKISFMLMLTQILIFYTSVDSHLNLRVWFANRYSFSGKYFIENLSNSSGMMNVVLASFLHWNLYHLLLNLFTILLFVVFLELLVGPSLVLCAYGIGVFLSNPLSLIFLFPLVKGVAPASFPFFFHEQDVGCSLGVYACIGTLACFTRYFKLIVCFFTGSVFVYSFLNSSWLSLNHLMALALGVILGKYYLSKQ